MKEYYALNLNVQSDRHRNGMQAANFKQCMDLFPANCGARMVIVYS